MQLTAKELEIVLQAEKSLKGANVGRVLVLITMIIGMSAMLYGSLKPDVFAYSSFGAILYAILMPQLRGPSYRDIVALLSRLRLEAEVQETNSIVDVLSRGR